MAASAGRSAPSIGRTLIVPACDERLGVAGGDDGVDFPVLEHVQGDHHRGIALGLQDGHRGVVRRDDGGRMTKSDPRIAQGTVFDGEQAEVVLVADEHQ